MGRRLGVWTAAWKKGAPILKGRVYYLPSLCPPDWEIGSKIRQVKQTAIVAGTLSFGPTGSGQLCGGHGGSVLLSRVSGHCLSHACARTDRQTEEAGGGHAERLLVGSQVTGRDPHQQGDSLPCPARCDRPSRPRLCHHQRRRALHLTRKTTLLFHPARDQEIPPPKLVSAEQGSCLVSTHCVENSFGKVRFKLPVNCSVAVKSDPGASVSL